MSSIVEDAYVLQSVFRCTAGFSSQWLLKCVAKVIHTHTDAYWAVEVVIHCSNVD